MAATLRRGRRNPRLTIPFSIDHDIDARRGGGVCSRLNNRLKSRPLGIDGARHMLVNGTDRNGSRPTGSRRY
jgi:hypothetical protein